MIDHAGSRRTSGGLAVVLMLAACGKGAPAAAPQPPAPPESAESAESPDSPLRAPDESVQRWLDEEPPPDEEEDDDGGTGVALALEEGKMGRTSDRTEGQYKMVRTADDGDAPAGRQAAVPLVTPGAPTVNGDVDRARLQELVQRQLPKIRYCYERELLVKPGLAGTVTVSYFISPSGSVSSSSATGVDAEVSSCVAGVIRGIEFARPRGGSGAQVQHPFVFAPTGG